MRGSGSRHAARTHVGLRRQVNEDTVLSRPDIGIWLVSDGMGGHDAGDFASRKVAETVAALPGDLAPGDRVTALRGAILRAHEDIRAQAISRGNGIIGATVAALVLVAGEYTVLWAGDSRVYLFRDGHVRMLSTDHSAVAALVAAGQMTWDQAEQHPHSNAITRAVGVGDHLDIDAAQGATRPGDRFLICSDGLTKYATFAFLETALAEGSPETLSDQLVQQALDGGGADNISVIVVDVT
ncbi:MAG: PP2C family protein-serine/threonine phosphatase [Marinibacterium sp.]